MVSPYPPYNHIGYINDQSIVIYDLIFDEKIILLKSRQYKNQNGFSSLEFGPNNIIWAFVDNGLHKFSLSSNKPEIIRVKQNLVVIKPSPAYDDVIAVISDDSTVSVFKGAKRTPIPHTVKNPTSIHWSPLGTSILIAGEEIQEWKESTPNVWRIVKKE